MSLIFLLIIWLEESNESFWKTYYKSYGLPLRLRHWDIYWRLGK